MKAVILAGGKGTRLRPLTYTRAKPMIPLMNKPAMEYIVTKLVSEGFKEIIITTNYMYDQIHDYFGEGTEFGAQLRVVNEDKPLGTAGSVKNAVDHLDDTFAVIQGDNISDINVGRLYREHKRMGGLATISLREVEDASLFGIAEMNGDEIVRYMEKPKPGEAFSNLANSGIYVFEPEVLDMIPLDFYDFSKGLFPKMLEEKKKICGVVLDDFWRDIGKPQDYLEATWYYLDGKNLLGEGAYIDHSKVIESVLGRKCNVSEAVITKSVLFDNVVVKNNATIISSIIGENCEIGENVDMQGAVIGDNVKIGDCAVIKEGAQIGPDVEIPANDSVCGIKLPDDIDTSE